MFLGSCANFLCRSRTYPLAIFLLHCRQLLSIWPGLRSLRTYWKDHRYGAHGIYLKKWQEVIRYCGTLVEDRHDTNRCVGRADERACESRNAYIQAKPSTLTFSWLQIGWPYEGLARTLHTNSIL
jgi:hypothetical protein